MAEPADAARPPGGSWEADQMLDVYILDLLRKRGFHQTAAVFLSEAKLSDAPVAIDAPGGFLLEWWGVFWDVFISRANDASGDASALVGTAA